MTNPPLLPTVPDAPPRALLTEADAGRIATAIEAELAPSTRAMYAGAWRQWERWCRGRGLDALPAAPEALAAYLTERAEAGLTFGTLDGYCSGIAHRHLQEGLSDPTADVVVRRVRRGLRRIMGVAPRRQAHPLTVPELAHIVSHIDTDRPIGIRDRAVILLGYASAMRPGEISALNIEDLITKPTGILISVRRSKTDQDARGQLVGVARGDNRVTDPSRALDAWLKTRPAGPGALFTRVVYPGFLTTERIGPRAVSRLVQQRANAAGFDGIPVTGHSLRAGHATTAAVNGASIDRIAAQTGTVTSALSSTTTSDRRRHWRIRPAATSASEEPCAPTGCPRWRPGLDAFTGSADVRTFPTGPCETASVFHERFEAAAQRVLAGDESVLAANELERIVVEDYPGDERLEDLHEALALYAPGQGPPYTGPDELRRAVRDALATLAS